jgi:hypothetical protein
MTPKRKKSVMSSSDHPTERQCPPSVGKCRDCVRLYPSAQKPVRPPISCIMEGSDVLVVVRSAFTASIPVASFYPFIEPAESSLSTLTPLTSGLSHFTADRKSWSSLHVSSHRNSLFFRLPLLRWDRCVALRAPPAVFVRHTTRLYFYSPFVDPSAHFSSTHCIGFRITPRFQLINIDWIPQTPCTLQHETTLSHFASRPAYQ